MVRTMDPSPLRKWILKNKYFIKCSEYSKYKKNNTDPPTHYLLDGGIWKVPMSNYQEFLRLLATDLQNGERYYISENRSELFRLVCDLDFYDESEIELPEIENIVKELQTVMDRYYQQTLNKVIICGTESKQKSIDEVIYTKTGFHLVWPKIWISTDNAKKLRIKFIEHLEKTFGKRGIHNEWDDVIDLAIYEDNGLRMIGSRKISMCKKCKNESECNLCNKTGKIDEGRVYKPISVIDVHQDENYFHKIKTDYYLLLLDTSIINYNSFNETPLITEIDVVLPINKKSKGNNNKKSSSGPVKQIDSESDHGLEVIKKLETFIKKNFKPHYNEIITHKLTKVDQMRYFLEPKNNFCMNVNRNHSSSGIYFNITPSGVSQRCMCKKKTTTGRLNGLCSEYHSKEIPLTKVLIKLLFHSEKNSSKFNLNVGGDENYLNICENILLRIRYQLNEF